MLWSLRVKDEMSAVVSLVYASDFSLFSIQTCLSVRISQNRDTVSRKSRNRNVNKFEFVASEADHYEADHSALMELSFLSVGGELSFVDICIFQTISGAEVYDQSWLVKYVC